MACGCSTASSAKIMNKPARAPELSALLDTGHKFRLTPYLEAEIDAGRDSFARQYVESADEIIPSLTDLADPIGDRRHASGRNLIHRYPDRALLLATDHCAAYCRFCFRKDRVGKNDPAASDADTDIAIDYIRETPALREIIFSGGDPLILSPRRLGALIEAVAAIDHVRIIRVHTRLPVVEPTRITDELADALRSVASSNARSG